MRRVLAMARKELRHLIRDPRTLGIALLLPVVMLFVYAYGVGLDIKHLKLGVLDHSQTPESRQLLTAMTQSGYFDLALSTHSRQELDEALETNRCVVALTIPQDFAKHAMRHEPAPLEAQLDASNPYYATAGETYLRAILQAQEGAPPLALRARVWYNPELRTQHFIVPGLLSVILMATSAILAANAIAREREQGTMERLVLSPLRSTELVLGKLLAYQLMGTVNIIVIVTLSVFWFRVPLRGDVLALFCCGELFLLSALGIGLLFSALIPSQQVAMFAAFVTTWAPSVLLSGFSNSIRSMPAAVQPITYALPARYFNKIVRDIYLRGASWPQILPEVLPMAAIGIGLVLTSVLVIRKRA